jgi:hypothetical protein
MAAREQAAPSRLLLDIDPELGTGIPEHELAEAHAACRVSLMRLEPGRWDSLPGAADHYDVLGFVVVEGLLCREIPLRESYMVELLGLGDIVVPPPTPDWPRLGGTTHVTAVATTTVA